MNSGVGGGGGWGYFEPVFLGGATSAAALHGIQMRAEHPSKEQFVGRVSPLRSPSFEAVNALSGSSKTVAIHESWKRGVVGGWPGTPSVIETSTDACFLAERGLLAWEAYRCF